MKALISHKHAKSDFEILETYEAGLVLLGHEVKSLRLGRGKLDGSHVVVRGGEAFLVGASIPPYQAANTEKSYDPERARKLLLKDDEIALLGQRSDAQGLTIVPIMVYNKGRNIKLEIALARGKKKFDKRESIKKRDTKRDMDRKLKQHYK